MEIEGKWTKDEEGYMDFDRPELQRYYEAVTDKYHQVYNRYLEDFDDEEEAYYKAKSDGYEMVTDYKFIKDKEEFATTYITPAHVVEVWYQTDVLTQKRVYDKGFIRIYSR